MEVEGGEHTSIVGDECHIISPKPNGPRHTKLDEVKYDSIGNLILLCKIHHKLVDDHTDLYTVDRLQEIKQRHETWVDEALRKSSKQSANVRFFKRITNGIQLTQLIGGCHAYLLDNEPPETEAEAELIGSFHQHVFDWGECWSDLEPQERVTLGFSLNSRINELEQIGLFVFASVVRYTTKYANGNSGVWPTLVLTIVHPTNPGITPLGELATVLAPTALNS